MAEIRQHLTPASPVGELIATTSGVGGPAPDSADLLPLQVWTARPDGQLDWVNRRVVEYFGCPPGEVLGAGWQKQVHPEDLPAVLERWSAALRSGEPYEVGFRLRRADGRYRTHIARAVPTIDEAGRVLAWFGTTTDVEDLHRVREELRESERRAAFLARVSRDLASSLDYQETLRNIARMPVPHFADWCAVDVVAPDGRIERLAVEHVDPERVVFVERIEERYPTDHSRPQGVGEVIRTGRAEWAREIPPGLLEEFAVNEEHLALIRQLALRSYIIAPVHGRERVRGAITFVYAESGRHYEEDDLPFVEDLAGRAGIALENAELVRNLVETRAQLEEQTTELEMQTAELEMQTEELQSQAAHLEEQSAELEMSNTELERALERLSRNEALLAEAQRSAQLGSWEWDMLSGEIAWTDQMYRLYGYEPQAVAVDFERYMAGIHPDDRPLAQRAIEEALRTNGSFVFEHRALGADGVERVLHCRGRVLLDDNGKPVRMTGSAQDVTEQRAAEEAVRRAHLETERANRVKSDFLASMSHELRTPLNAIGGHVELIAMGIHGPITESQRAALERIRASQEHLLGLINDILQFARVEAGRLEYRIAPLPVGDVLVGVVGVLEAQARMRGLELSLERVPGELTVQADPDRLQQILFNLIGNAIKFTENGGRVAVGTSLDGGDVLIHVSDTGRGIAADDLETIFDPFVQVRASRAGDAPQGVGLGLAISRDLARAMKGDLTVRSELGRGSVFTVRLPAGT